MKLVIQIPCLDEAAQLPATLAALPRSLPGVDAIERLVIDDGSADGTAEVARAHGVEHVVRLADHRGLAAAFAAGLEAAVRAGADVIVNTDADNQYRAEHIGALVGPVLRGEADIVVGARPIEAIAHFSVAKRWLQRRGSGVVRLLTGLDVPDATSGFRAYSRDAALRLVVFSNYTYTLETLVQAGQVGLAVRSVPVAVNPPTRPSRLIRSTASYVVNATLSMLRAFVVYRPLRSLAIPAVLALAAGTLVGARFVWLYVHSGGAAGHLQSLILAAVLISAGLLIGVAAVLADLIAANRRLLEDIRFRMRREEWTRR